MNIRIIRHLIRAMKYAKYIIPVLIIVLGGGGGGGHGGDPIDGDPVF